MKYGKDLIRLTLDEALKYDKRCDRSLLKEYISKIIKTNFEILESRISIYICVKTFVKEFDQALIGYFDKDMPEAKKRHMTPDFIPDSLREKIVEGIYKEDTEFFDGIIIKQHTSYQEPS